MSPSVRVAPVQSSSPSGDAVRFVVGQDPSGRWVAAEIHGRAGGLFRSRHDAMHFAEGETDHRPGSVSVSSERVELRL